MRNFVLAAALIAGGFALAPAPASAADVRIGFNDGRPYGGYQTVGYRDRDWDGGGWRADDRGYGRGDYGRDRYDRGGGWRGSHRGDYRRSYFAPRPDYYRSYRPRPRYYAEPRRFYAGGCRTTRIWNGYETIVRRRCY